jgi:hypothetical protein
VTWPESVRDFVSERASRKCEYCLLDQADAGLPHEIDHVISRKHGGTTALENLAYACYLCNRYKGSDIASIDPKTGSVVRLFHPRQDRWTDHFQIAGPVLQPLTEIGMATAILLRLNVAGRVAERKLLQSLGRYPRVLSS